MMIRTIRQLVTMLFGPGALTRARRGQATIMFAFMAVPMIGMLGLVVDSGVYLYARRTTQAAADAAALAGARQLSQSTTASPQPAQAEVEAVVALNGQGSVTPSVQECRYVDDSNTPIGPANCTTPIPTNASGVMVRTQVTVPTFFINVIPGAPASSVATGQATAHVQRAEGIKADAPFLVCGIQAITESDGPIDIIGSENPFTINPDAIGKTFNIHGPHVASCGLQKEGFKGLLSDKEKDDNANREVPGPLVYETGVEAGPTGQRVDGPGGCEANTTPPYTCVMLLPVATATEDTSAKVLPAVGFAAFEVTSSDTNEHQARLIGSYILPSPGVEGWKHGDGGVITVRLTG